MRITVARALLGCFTAAAAAFLFFPRDVSLAEGEKQALSVEIAAPEKNGKRTLPLSGEFHVVVTNLSDKPVKLFSQACAEGRRQLLFEIIDGGYSWSVYRKPENIRRNIRVFETLEPGEPLVIHVDLSSPAWEHQVPLEELKGRKLEVRAVFVGSAAPMGTAGNLKAIDKDGNPIEPGKAPEPAPRPKSDDSGTGAWTGEAVSAKARTYTIE